MSVIFTDKSEAAMREILLAAARIVGETALETEADIKTAMAEPKSGRVDKRKGRTHQASAPGEAPAIDTGLLVNSINTETEELIAEIGTNVEYAPVLEIHLERPAWAQAGEKAKNTFQRNAEKHRNR